VYSSLMMKSVFFHHHEPNPALVWSKGGGGVVQLPDATRSTQVPRPHTRLPLSLSPPFMLPRLLCLVAPRRRCACMLRRCHAAVQTHVTTMPKSSAIPGYLTGLFTTGPRSIPRPGVFKGGEEKGCFGRGCSFGFYVLRSGGIELAIASR
jgi:hypothetical protein